MLATSYTLAVGRAVAHATLRRRWVAPGRTSINRLVILSLLVIACGALAVIFLAYQHPALLLNFGNLQSCG